MQKLDTHEVHLQKKTVKDAHLWTIIKLNTHGVHLQKKTVKNAHLQNINLVHLWKKTVKNESFIKLSGYKHNLFPFGKSSNTYALLLNMINNIAR